MKTIATKMLIMRPGKPDETKTIELEHDPGYDKLMTLMRPIITGANHIEHVSVLSTWNGRPEPGDMFVDEDFIEKELPRNEAATTIYRRATMEGYTGVQAPADPETLPMIRGTAVLFDRRVWF